MSLLLRLRLTLVWCCNIANDGSLDLRLHERCHQPLVEHQGSHLLVEEAIYSLLGRYHTCDFEVFNLDVWLLRLLGSWMVEDVDV